MNFQKISLTVLCGAAFAFSGCHHNKMVNPIANVDSKQPDKVLFDRAAADIKNGKYEIARSVLQTMINTYPDSEFVARAKLSIADSWYAEGNTAAYAQAEREYKDFRTFFPNMPEAAEAQMKIANIHYDEMGKPDRDYTQARRAEDEYRQMIQDYPDHKLTPLAKQRLREVQEVLGEGEFRVAHFYYGRESWPAAIARFKTLADTYPLYSQADAALFLLGQSYENEMSLMQNSKMRLRAKARQQLIADFRKNADDAYSRVVERYPAGDYADAAAKRLQALEFPVPHATPEAIAQNKQEIASRGEAGMKDRVLLNFSHRPDTAMAAKVGEPTLEDPQQASAPAIALHASEILRGDGGANVNAEVIGNKTDTADPSAPKLPAAAAPPASTQPAAPAAFESIPEDPHGVGSTSSTTAVPDVSAPKAAQPNAGATTTPSTSGPIGSAASASDAAPSPAATTPEQAPPSAGTTPDATPAAATQGQATPANTTADTATGKTAQSDAAGKSDSSSTKTKKKKHKFNPF